MNIFKDFLRVVALVLIVRAVYTDSVACAISAGTLYMGGFDAVFHMKNLFKGKRDMTPEQPSLTTEISGNVVHLRRS